MNFSPVRKSKHNGIKTECVCGVVHDSRKEARRCADLRLLEKAGAIICLKSHPRYTFSVNGNPVMMDNGQQARITLDFSYFEMPSEKLIVEDVKPASKRANSRDYPIRKAFFKALYPQAELREIR